MELFDLNSILNNLLESSSIKAFLVDFLIDSLMCSYNLLLALPILTFFSSGLILIKSQPNFFSNPFCLGF